MHNPYRYTHYIYMQMLTNSRMRLQTHNILLWAQEKSKIYHITATPQTLEFRLYGTESKEHYGVFVKVVGYNPIAQNDDLKYESYAVDYKSVS